MMDKGIQSGYAFGPFRLDALKRCLLREGELVPLQPRSRSNQKDFETLLVLVRERERVVEKEELIELLWPDTFVEEANLSQHIYVIRKALGDALAWWWMGSAPDLGETAGIKFVAVLPFKPLRADGNDEYLGLGLADSLITKLGGLRSLIVRPTSAVRNYAGPAQDPLAAGSEQKVDAVLDATLQRAGNRIRVTARLLRVKDGGTLWAYQCDEGYCAEIFAMQDAISEKIAAAMVAQMSGAERQALRKHGTENREAYEQYLRGSYFWNKALRLGDTFYFSGLNFLEEAKMLTEQRRYVMPWAIAVAYAALGDRDQAFAWMEKAYEERPLRLGFLKVDPVFDSLRADPRFANLQRRVGLAP